MKRLSAIFASTVVAMSLTSVAAADSVMLEGLTSPTTGCRIQAIRNGRVHYIDAGGRVRTRDIEEIRSLGFDKSPEVERGERALLRGDYGNAVRWYLKARVETEHEPAVVWIHARLAHTHATLGETVQAYGHLAEVLRRSPDTSWLTLVADVPADQPWHAAALESRTALEQAGRSVQDPALREAIERMLATVAPIEVATRGTRPARHRRTWSGYAVEAIRNDDWSAAMGDPSSPTTNVPTTTPPVAMPESTLSSQDDDAVATTGIPAGLDGVEALLAAGRTDEALERCEDARRVSGGHETARGLYWRGRALEQSGYEEEAAVCFTRCAILHPGTLEAPRSLLATAGIYITRYERPSVARRLADRALAILPVDDDRAEIAAIKAEAAALSVRLAAELDASH